MNILQSDSKSNKTHEVESTLLAQTMGRHIRSYQHRKLVKQRWEIYGTSA